MELWNRPDIREARDRLLEHPVYQSLDTVEALRIFMQHHVFAVWDFMSLLKRLQLDMNPVSLPWIPPRSREQARFINEVVMVEESDNDIHGGHISHFELYLDAMKECGADTSQITRFIAGVTAGDEPAAVFERMGAPETIRQFVGFTLQTALHAETHAVCAAFFFGRENLIPDMFDRLIQGFAERGALPYRFLYYLHRHVEVDGDHHGPLAQKMLSQLCEGSDERMEGAIQVALSSLRHRGVLWDGVLREIRALDPVRLADAPEAASP